MSKADELSIADISQCAKELVKLWETGVLPAGKLRRYTSELALDRGVTYAEALRMAESEVQGSIVRRWISMAGSV